ncbi:hypothetical protein GEMRC1_013544 [Eukaryota sp. GEM-RC1]
MTSGEIQISLNGTLNCPHWISLLMSNDAEVFINETNCISTIESLVMQDQTMISSLGKLYVDDYSLIGGSVGKNSVIHVIDNFSATTDQPKFFGLDSILLSILQVTSLLLKAIQINILPSTLELLSIASNDTAFSFKTDCADCQLPTGFVNEGNLTIFTPEPSIFEVDIVSSGYLSFENNSVMNLQGNTILDGSTFIRNQTVVTVTGSLHQLSNDILNIDPGTDEGRLILDSEDSSFNGEIHCQLDLVCLTITSGVTTFKSSMTSPSYINFEVIDATLSHQGFIEEVVCDLLGGSFLIESGSSINIIDYCHVDGEALLQHQGNSFTNDINHIDIYVGTHQLLSNSTVFSDQPIFNLYDDTSMFETQSGSLFYLTSGNFTINKGDVVFESESTATSPHFTSVRVFEGTLSIDLECASYIDYLLLESISAIRSGSGFVNVTAEFVFIQGSLSGNGTTYSHTYMIINTNSVTQTISNEHTVLINNEAEFTLCNILGSQGGLITVLPNSFLNISGKCSLVNVADSTKESLLLNEGLITTNHDDVHFDWDLIWRSFVYWNWCQQRYLVTSLSSTDFSVLNGTDDAHILLDNPTSLLNVTGFYEVYGELLLDHTQSMTYFNSNCKIAFINTRVLRGLLHVSGNCIADDVIAYVSDRIIVDSQSIIHLISSLDLNDGHVIVDGSASIREVANVTLNLDSLIEVKGSAELISSKINLQMINRAQFIVSHDSRFIVTNGEFFLPDDVIFQISTSVHGDVELLNLYLRNDAIFNVSCIIPIQIRNFYHFGGHRSGDSDVYINIFYHWSGGKLSSHLSTSTTIVTSAATASLDSTGTMNPRIIDNHQLNISGDGDWTRSDTTLIGGFMRVTSTSTFTLDQLEQLTLQGDFDSHLYVHGRFIKDNSYSFIHNCPTFVDGSYIIEEGNVYTQKPVIVSDGLTSIINGHLFIEDFVFIDCTSILNGTVEAQISLLNPTSLLNVTGFYEVYGELLLDHTQSMTYFNSNCKIAFINTRVLRGLLHVSGNCIADDVIAYVSDRIIVDSQSIIHLISSLDLNDGHVIVDGSASIREVANVTLNLDSLIEVKGSAELISSKINLQMINSAQFIVSHDSRFIVTNGEFFLPDDVIFQISSSVHGDVELLNLYLRNDAIFNVSCIIPIQIRNFYHFGGHRSGDSDVYINIFYHWSGGKLSSHLSTSTTIVTSAATASLDSTGTMNPRIIDNHQLNISGDGTWTRSDTTLIGGFMRVTSTSTFSLDQLEQLTLQGDFDSHLYVHGRFIKDNSYSFNHNCPTFVDGSYIIEEGNVYTQKPVIVSDGLTSIINGHLFIEDFVFIDCTSIFNGTVETQISLLEPTSLLNVTGFYEVYGELLLDHTQSMAYFNSNCKIEFINTRVLRGLLHVSGNCIADDVITYVSDRMIVDSQSIIHLISSLDLNDGHVIVDSNASIREVVDVTLNLDSLIEVKGSSELISSKINLQMINRAQFIVSHDSRFIITNGEFLLRNDVICQISSSVHGDVELLHLFLRDDSTFNVSCIIPIQIRNFYHFGGHRSGDSDVYINIFYHWSGGKLSSHLYTSTTIVTSAATGLLDSTGTMNPRIIDNHLLLLIGDVTWTHSDTSLLSGFINITTDSTLTILNQEDVELDGDFDSHLYVHGHLIKDNSHSFSHNCPTFVDGSYIIEEGNVYTQKPVIVSNGVHAINNGHLFIEEFFLLIVQVS